VERGAEIAGTITYDDGSPAIGIWPQILRKTAANGWVEAAGVKNLALAAVTDGHGRYSLTNLSAGEYIVCALLPVESDEIAPRICLGNVFRRKDAATLKVQAGESANGADIVVPLTGLHTVAGRVTVLSDGHAPDHATIRLLYADDREKAREIKDLDEGSFSFPYVPEGKYILEVADANDGEQQIKTTNPDGTSETTTVPNSARHYAGKELPVTVQDDMDDLQIALNLVPRVQPPTP
jgi:hypothetical protein